jgi:hypothetical protein
MKKTHRAGNIGRVKSSASAWQWDRSKMPLMSAWRKSTIALSELVLEQRTESSAKQREKIAASHGSRHLRRQLRWSCLRDVKELFRLPPYSRQKAKDVKLLLKEYHFCTARMKLIQIEAERVARASWLAVRGESVSGRTIRLWLARERVYGGPTRAPIKSYADAKSCPHRKSSRTRSCA